MTGPQPLTQARADAAFMLYWQMGPERSLEKLADIGATLGLRGSLKTLKRWSADFRWQARLIEFDAKAAERIEERVIGDVVEMNSRQALLGRSMQAIAKKRLDLFNEVPATLDAADVARMAEVGTKLERLAMGEVTERRQVMLSILNVVIRPLCELFGQVNGLPDEQERLRRFAIGADDVVDRYLIAGPAGTTEAI